MTWSDRGTPRRVVATLTRLGRRPAWMTEGLHKQLAHAAAAGPPRPGRPRTPGYREVS